MGTTIEKLNKVLESKNRLKQALINKGQNVGDLFSEYPTAVDNIPVGITPTGTLEITDNGEKDVTQYAKVNVNVEASGGAELNIHYGLEPPIDTSKLWVKTGVTPSKVDIVKNVEGGNVGMNTGIGTLPTRTVGVACGVVGTKCYLFGGSSDNGSLNTINVLDAETNTITTLSTTLPIKKTGMACGVVGTKCYLFGGTNYSNGTQYLNTINVFNTETNTITTLSATLPTGAQHIACGVVGTKIYLFGGYNSGYLNNINVFDTTSNTITTLSATLPTGATRIACGVVGTKCYLFGGTNPNGNSAYFNTINVFDTETNTITTLSTILPNGLCDIACGVVGTKCYLFGGSGASNDIGSLNTINVFDTETNTITTLSETLPTRTADIACGVVGKRCYLFGGYVNNTLEYSNTINLFIIAIPLNQNNILLLQDFTKEPFKLINSENTNVEMSIGHAYIGNANNESEEVAYGIFNGTIWEGEILSPPTISITDNTLTITNPSDNGSLVDSYDVYEDGSLLTNITTTTLDLSTLITEAGTYAITVKAKGTNFNDSVSSNSVDYIVSNTDCIINYSLSNYTYMIVDNVTYHNESGSLTVPSGTLVRLECGTSAASPEGNMYIRVDGTTVASLTYSSGTLDYDYTVNGNITIKGIAAGSNIISGEIDVTTTGYTVNVSGGGMYGFYGYYSLDNGVTWENFSDLSSSCITNVTQIKFKVDDRAYNNGIYVNIDCEQLNMALKETGPLESENFTLTSDITVSYYDMDY